MWWTIFSYGVIFYLGVFFGVLISWWLKSRKSYSGTIFVTETEEKTLYSLELEEYPEELRFKQEVVFKVDASELDRE